MPSLIRASPLLAIGLLALAAAPAPGCGESCTGDARCLSGECVPIAREGAACTPGSCAGGLWCPPPASRCARTSTVGPDCDPDAEKPRCGDGWCDPVTRRCLPLPSLGDDCTVDGQCAIDGFCFEGKCVSLPGEHEPCLHTTGPACALGLVCKDELCAPPATGACPPAQIR